MNAQPDALLQSQNAGIELATLGGGCFWCTEALFENLDGVKSVVSGYAGGRTAHPTYEQICTGRTGHAEVVQIEFDPARISYERLLEIFWEIHDPTTLNRQGADHGTQYRSIILYHDPAQQKAAEISMAAAKTRKGAIVTELVPLEEFFPAEEYHQDYFRSNPNKPYCALVIVPKMRRLQKSKAG